VLFTKGNGKITLFKEWVNIPMKQKISMKDNFKMDYMMVKEL
jgi:hypothetical protein